MMCPVCDTSARVTDSRERKGYTTRRRKCTNDACRTRWTTMEVIIPDTLITIFGTNGPKKALQLWLINIGEALHAEIHKRRTKKRIMRRHNTPSSTSER